MDVNLLHAHILGHFDQTEQMLDVAVHAAVGQQADEVQGLIVLDAVVHCANNGEVFADGAVFDVLGDFHQHLVNHPAGADVGVANLGVAHLAVRQANV